MGETAGTADPDTVRHLARYGLRLAAPARPVDPAKFSTPVAPPSPRPVPAGLTLPSPAASAAPRLGDPGAQPLPVVSPRPAQAGAHTLYTVSPARPADLPPGAPRSPEAPSFRAAPVAPAAPTPLQAEELEPLLERLLTQALLREGVDL